jgi:excisionase family DNA binding protein
LHARRAPTNKLDPGRRDQTLTWIRPTLQLDKGNNMVPQNPLDDNIPVDLLLTVNEVAKCLKVSPQVVHKLARYGHLNKVKVGSLTRIERSELLRFISDGGGDFNG